MMMGITYGGVDQEGKVDWYSEVDVHILHYETCTTLEEVIQSLHLSVNRWVSW